MISNRGHRPVYRQNTQIFFLVFAFFLFWFTKEVCCVDSYLTFIACINSFRPRLHRCPFADDIFKCIFSNENEWILPRISLKFVPKVLINNIPALVQIMAWRRPGDKPLSEPMMVSLLTHICVTRPQWVDIEEKFLRLCTSGIVYLCM